MDFIGKVSDIAKTVSEKAGDIWETGKIGAKIHNETLAADTLKKKIGEICYMQYKAGKMTDPEILSLCEKIEKHGRSIAQYQQTLRKKKESGAPSHASADRYCIGCGIQLAKDAKFCPHCGREAE